MSSLKKTIQINPELFKISGFSKTRKNKEKKQLQLTPIISPSNLKSKWLKKIKDHKTRETNTHNINNGLTNKSPTNKSPINKSPTNNNSTFSDEFYGAMDYFSDLTKKQKRETEKDKYRSNLNNRTLKNHSNIPSITNISLELPPELQEAVPIKSSYFIPDLNNTVPAMTMNYSSNSSFESDVPYGCLKNGSKPTYRDWVKTRKNHEQPDLSIRPPTPPKRNTFMETSSIKPINPIVSNVSILSPSVLTTPTSLSREQRLEQIKQKLKKIQEQEIQSIPEAAKLNNNLKALEAMTPEIELESIPELDNNTSKTIDITEIIKEKKSKEENVPKQYLKKTVHRKFTLGKSDKLRKVAVLLKDKQTRKRVIDVQHDLKKTSMADVRKYLRQHGITKIGSSAPNEILRKTFEAAMLAGEITNINKDTILHNFINEDTSSL
jgi:hypothetical protein